MAYQSEIEKLENRYRENPDQWFAALADQYRKAGDLEMAIEVVRAGIVKRPNYVSGHIVLGRCLLDQKNDLEAGQAFRRVLELDGENIMALKFLGDIAQRAGDSEGARGWLSRLLDVDPMNDEARDALDRLGPAPAAAAKPAQPAVPVLSLESESEPGGPLAGFEATSLAGEPAPAPAPPPAIHEAEATPAPALEPLELETTSLAPEAPAASADIAPLDGGWDAPAPAEEAPEAPATPEWRSSLPHQPSSGYERTVEVAPIRLGPKPPVSPPADPPPAIFADEPAAAGADEAFWASVEDAAPPPVAPPALDLPWMPADEGPAIESRGSSMDSEPLIEPEPPTLGSDWEPADASPPADAPALPDGGDDPWATPAASSALAWSEPASPMVPEAREPEFPREPIAHVEGFVTPIPPSSAGPAPSPPPLELVPFDDRLAWGTGERTSREIKQEDLAAAARLYDASIDHDTARFVVGDLAQSGAASVHPLPRADTGPGRVGETVAESLEPEPVVTETMAELYANQGLVAEARAVYEQLVLARPGDARLEARLLELRAAGSGPLPRRVGRLAASMSGGTPVRGFLSEILRARGARAAPVPMTSAAASESPVRKTPQAVASPMEAAFEREPAGAPTVPATDDVSLSAVFGDEPPPSAPPPASAASGGAQPGGFSFDEFFGARPPEPPSRPKTRASQADTDPSGEDDFKAWLKGLKT